MTGAGPIAAFFLVVIPLIRTSLVVGLLLGVTRSFGEVGISLMLGGNIAQRTNTLSLEVFNAVSRGDFERATALCVLLARISLCLYLAIDQLQRRRHEFSHQPALHRRTAGRRLSVHGFDRGMHWASGANRGF